MFDRTHRSIQQRPPPRAGSRRGPRYRPQSSGQAITSITDDFIIGQMLILFRERPEIRDDLGELGAVYPPFPPARFGFGEAFIHGALDRLRQGLTGPLGELANFGLGGRILMITPIRGSVYIIIQINIYLHLAYWTSLKRTGSIG